MNDSPTPAQQYLDGILLAASCRKQLEQPTSTERAPQITGEPIADAIATVAWSKEILHRQRKAFEEAKSKLDQIRSRLKEQTAPLPPEVRSLMEMLIEHEQQLMKKHLADQQRQNSPSLDIPREPASQPLPVEKSRTTSRRQKIRV